MSSPAFEGFLARLYVDSAFRARFLADPEGEARRAGLSCGDQAALRAIDRKGLELAAHSYEMKRRQTANGKRNGRR
ncbi:MAG TPA: hypothetical protein VFC90_13035 [Planctomycetota bacterium]|nr:hypothetical protein [Planctomycetota bacterium]